MYSSVEKHDVEHKLKFCRRTLLHRTVLSVGGLEIRKFCKRKKCPVPHHFLPRAPSLMVQTGRASLKAV